MEIQANNLIKVDTSLTGKFFTYWLNFLKPFHQLTTREIEIVATFLKIRYELSKSILDTNILDTVLMSKDVKNRIRKECNMTTSIFQVILTKLKKKKIIIDNKINPKFIPNIKEENGKFILLLYFDLK